MLFLHFKISNVYS